MRMTSSTTEDYNTGDCLSYGSLEHPCKEKNKRAINSEPFIKPKMTFKQKLLEKIFSHLHIKEHQDSPKPTDFTLKESKFVLRELAAELDQLLQLKNVSILSGVVKGEISEDESRAVVLQWADVLKNRQSDTDKMNLNNPHRAEEAEKTLKKELKKKQKESVCFREECKAVVKDLYKQWKKGHLVNILPVMDFIIRTALQDNMSEESNLKQWFKSEKMFKKAGGMRVPDTVWNWITKPSVNVKLDPETANPDLLLSEDGKAVRSKTHKESSFSSFLYRRPSKFDGWPCVQAVDGFSTGRHYWEVEVKGKSEWRIGVVKDSAPRHGFVNMNTTAGYWTLRLQLGSLMALTNPVTKLNQPNPSKIGVYLDIEEGQVSFYETEQRRHIYTFKTNFRKSEKIYPVFGTVETHRPLWIM
ncbi:hypothetical protein AMEX_G13891 [Astyanax mexicanus]|uniref:B30.2/SPRY domain-containing protein n=1 Tax=Astyanax mexicanus TaxID=7994 RepID=A0A8T2LMA1_ASTMX|nr:hypothetical protein AMEX_G13891 [Astyanax mexicanus]